MFALTTREPVALSFQPLDWVWAGAQTSEHAENACLSVTPGVTCVDGGASSCSHLQYTPGNNLVLAVTLAGKPLRALVDTGATHSFIDAACARTSGMIMHPIAPFHVAAAGGKQLTLNTMVMAQLKAKKAHTDVQLAVMPDMLRDVDIILGMDWLATHKAQLNIERGTLTLMARRRRYTLRCESALPPDELGVAQLRALRVAPEQFVGAPEAVKLMKQGCRSWLMCVDARTPMAHVASIQSSEHDSSSTDTDAQALGADYMSRVHTLLERFADVFTPLTGLPPNKAVYQVIPTVPGVPAPYKRP